MKKKIESGIKSIHIPNGFIVIGQMGLPVLIDFDDAGIPVNKATELNSDGWLEKGKMQPDLLALVHTVKGSEKMLIKALLILRLSGDGIPITAVKLGKANKLNEVAKKIRDKYVQDLELQLKDPTHPVKHEYILSEDTVTSTSPK